MDGELKIYIVILAILAVFGLIYAGFYHASAETVEIVVDAKDIKYHNNDAKYLVSSDSGEVFEITDTYTFMRFDSSDLYFNMQPGVTYSCKVAGWRVPYLSWYRNILTANEVHTNAT